MVPEIWSATDKIFCHSGPFFSLLPPYGPRKSEFWKMNNTPEDIITLQMCTVNDSHMMYGSWDMKCNEQNFLSFWTVFCHFTPLTTQKIKIWKTEKKAWIYYHFTHVYHKLQSYDVEFLRYQASQTGFFCHLDNFLPIYPLKTQKIKILKYWKKHLEILSFYTSVPKIMII